MRWHAAPMKVLVLGGTQFVGPAFVDEALARGWDVTVASRGLSGPPAAGARSVRLDRSVPGAFSGLASETFDLVVDTWAGAPAVARVAARALAGSTGRWVYVSSRSVYSWPLPRGADESAPTTEADPDTGETHYAADKRGAELALDRELGPTRVVHLRAGLILGPRDNVGRLPWWLARMARGGPTLVPAPPSLGIQYVDVRDLARFGLDAAAAGRSGPVDVVCPAGSTTWGSLLAACLEVTGTVAELVWVDPGWLLEQEVEPWTEVPIWIPESQPGYALHDADVSRAQSWGLVRRSLDDTVRDTWTWMSGGGVPGRSAHSPAGLLPEHEAALLERWRQC